MSEFLAQDEQLEMLPARTQLSLSLSLMSWGVPSGNHAGNGGGATSTANGGGGGINIAVINAGDQNSNGGGAWSSATGGSGGDYNSGHHSSWGGGHSWGHKRC